MKVIKCYCDTGERPLGQIVEWKSESQSNRKHSASGVGAASSSLRTGIVAGSSLNITWLGDFPTDVIFNILSRLPLKSLVCCRCVCKLWRNIIDSPSFTYIHFTTHSADTAEENQLMILYHAIRIPGKIKKFSLMDDGTNVLSSSEFPIAEIANSYKYIVSSLSYGLLCFENSRGMVFLLNPLRGEVLMLPPATRSWHADCYGVGFDRTTETFKVVHVFSRNFDRVLVQHDLAAEVHTLGTRSWREIPSVPPCYPDRLAVSAYGDVHWQGVRCLPDGSIEQMIVSFDIRKEEFKLTPHPNLPSKLFNSFHLLYFRGHLAMVDHSSTTHIEVWMLKDYDKKEWAMEYRISAELMLRPDNVTDGFRTHVLRDVIAVGAWEHGILFMSEPKKLCYYDPKTDSLKFMCIPPYPRNFAWCNKLIISYNGSLVSLKNLGNMVARAAGLRNYFDLSTVGPAS